MKVYLVRAEYDNGEPYEDNYTYSCIEAICATRELAEKFISEIKLPGKWVDGDPYDDMYDTDAIRKTYESGEHYYELPTRLYYIDEMEMIE